MVLEGLQLARLEVRGAHRGTKTAQSDRIVPMPVRLTTRLRARAQLGIADTELYLLSPAGAARPARWFRPISPASKASDTAVGTLVERMTGFVMLLHLSHGHGTLAVQQALVAKMLTLDEQLLRSLTWDQGREMTNHREITQATGLDIYFCDPRSPWQRGTNENTNGLLRRYLPKGADRSLYGPGMLDNIAAELNSRPRKRHGSRTPAEQLEETPTKTINHPGVA